MKVCGMVMVGSGKRAARPRGMPVLSGETRNLENRCFSLSTAVYAQISCLFFFDVFIQYSI